MCNKVPLFSLTGFILGIVAVVFDVIGIATTNWLVAENAETKYYYGLWESCTETTSSTFKSCTYYSFSDHIFNWFNWTRLLEGLALFLLVLLMIIYIRHLFVLKGKSDLLNCLATVSFVAFLCALVGAILFAAKTTDTEFESSGRTLHFSFALVIVASIFSLLSGILVLLEHVHGNKVNVTEDN